MPSEAQSQEPRDRGLPPPVTRAGRSAQLAKAAATHPAPDRRTRGRPRRDGRSAAPPSPPPPPLPKSRKKGRSRGRAQVEDEESMDTTEKSSPHRTEPKEAKEKAPGRRRPASRRKSNSNPDPDPDPEPSHGRLSPDPEPDPDPAPPQRDPSTPKSGSEQTSSAEVKNDSDPLVPPVFSLKESHPQVSPPTPPSPDLSLVQYSAPSSPVGPLGPQEDQPCPSCSPTPMEVDCSPSRVAVETEVGGASPMEQSPSLSPGSSPPASPCLRLEEEDSLSPLFQRCLSEDSGGSPTPSLGHTEKRLKQCAFCFRGDDLSLGQGHLVVFGPTPGYIPLHILNRRASSDRDNDCHDHCYRSNQAPPTCNSPEQCDQFSSEFISQLGPIGLPHDINVQSLFDPTGQCCAHLQCAGWSEGVCRGEGQSLLYVDKAIDSGSTQVCAFCHRLGATLHCQETGCGRSYHFICAAAAGAHQDWSQRHTLCTRHTHTGSSLCTLCLGSSEAGGLLMCCSCGNRYHGSCLDPPVVPSPLCRAGWQCPQCRVCQSCRLRGDDGVLLVCDRCDKVYHPHCLTPPLDRIPSTGWSCKSCRVCRRCGVRSSGQWANHPFLCESCDPALPCPPCGHSPNLHTPQEYLTCVHCYRCVHADCVLQSGGRRTGSEDYLCPTCRPQEEGIMPDSLNHATPLSSSQAPSISQSQPPISSSTEAPALCPPAHITQCPTETTCALSPQSLTSAHSEPLEPAQSPAPGPSEPPQSPAPGPSEPPQSPAPGPSEPPQSPAPGPSEPPQSPAPGPSEPPQSPAPGPPEPPQSPAPGPSDPPQSPAPGPLEPPQSPGPCLSNPPQSPAPGPPEPPQSPAPCLSNPPQSPAPGPSDPPQSPGPGPPEPPQSPAPGPSDPPQSPSPGPPEPPQSPAPGPSDPPQSPSPGPPEPPQSPAPCLSNPPQSPAPGPSDPPQSPAPGPLEPPQIPAPGSPELPQSPAPGPPEPPQSPAPGPPEPPHIPPPGSPELPQSPSPGPPELPQSPSPGPSEPPQSPAPGPSELPQSPSPGPPELPQSPSPGPSEPPQSPAPGPSEPPQSPAPGPSEPPQSPAPGPSEPPQSPGPCPTEPSQSPQSPAVSSFNPTEPPESPATLKPSEPVQSPAPLKPSEPVQSPAPLKPSEPVQSPAPLKPSEPVQSPATASVEVPQSSASCHLKPSSTFQSPSPIKPDSAEQSPMMDLTVSPQTPTPCHLKATEGPQSPHSPASSHLEPSEPAQSSAPRPQEPLQPVQSPTAVSTEVLQISAPDHSEPSEPAYSPGPVWMNSPQSPAPTSTEVPLSPVASEEPPCSPAPPQLPPPELPQDWTASESKQQESQQSPACSVEVHGRSPPPYPDPTETGTSPSTSLCEIQDQPEDPCSTDTPSPPCPVNLEQGSPPTHCSPKDLEHSPRPSSSGPAESDKIPVCISTTQVQLSPLSGTSSGPAHTSTEDQLMAAESQLSIPPSCVTSHSPTQSGFSPSRAQTGTEEPQPDPRLQSPSLDHAGPRSPSYPATSSSPSPTSHGCAQVSTSSPQSPTQEAELTLDQERPGLSSHASPQRGVAETISTLDLDLSSIYRRSKKTAARQRSAPCSPSSSPLRTLLCSRSMPASPVQAGCPSPLNLLQTEVLVPSTSSKKSPYLKTEDSNPTKLFPDLQVQARGSSPTSGQAAEPSESADENLEDHLNPGPCPPAISAPPAPESLVHSSSSQEHSGLSPSLSLLPHRETCTPAYNLQACLSPEPEETDPTSFDVATRRITPPTKQPSGLPTGSWCEQSDSPVRPPVENLLGPGSSSDEEAESGSTAQEGLEGAPSHTGHMVQSGNHSPSLGPVSPVLPGDEGAGHPSPPAGSSPVHCTLADSLLACSPVSFSQNNISSDHHDLTSPHSAVNHGTPSPPESGPPEPRVGLVEPSDCFMAPSPALSIPEQSTAAGPTQAPPSPLSQSVRCPDQVPESSSPGDPSAAPLSSVYQRPESPTDERSSRAASRHSSPAQDRPATPHISWTPASPESPAPQRTSPHHVVFPGTPQHHDGLACSTGPHPVDCGQTQTTLSPGLPPGSSTQPEPSPHPRPSSPVQQRLSPGPSSPVHKKPSPGPCLSSPAQPEPTYPPGSHPASPVHCEDSLGPDRVSPTLASIEQCSPGPESPMQLDAECCPGPVSLSEVAPHKVTPTERWTAVSVDTRPAEEQEQEEQLTAKHEPHRRWLERTAAEEPVRRTEGGGDQEGEAEEEEEVEEVVSCITVVPGSPAAPHQAAPPAHQPTTPRSALPPPQPPSPSPPASPFPSLQTPPAHLLALAPSSSQTPPPSLKEASPEDTTLFCPVTSADDDSQSQSVFEPVAVATEPAKDEPQSRASPAQEEEEPAVVAQQQPISEEQEKEDQSDEEEEEEEMELVSPVLDLDPSLDLEVMELMGSYPPPSLLHLSTPSPPALHHRGKGRSLRPPPCSSARPSDDLSIRLRQSPFSTEASPETSPTRVPVTPPPLTPPSPPLRSPPSIRESPPLSKLTAPPSLVLPLTPKMGMGKPAITRRKFSPGRVRLSRQGRGSGFPGRRRSRGGGGVGRGGRGRSRLKTQDSLTVSPGSGSVETFQVKEEEENSMHNTVVMFSTSDHYTLRQDMCVVCGSFGQGAEGRLLACSQCGQCYHPYCVNVKITRVILTKGWRCLECTVCEACGEASDPGRLLLCDDCDISYHTYCLDPPLHTVPKGAWKCKWCVWCVQCGSTSPGRHCEWQSNYNCCGLCASLSCCPLCQRTYLQDDLILQCQQCDRWVHAVCQGLTSEEEVEAAADRGFDCTLCRTQGRSSYGRSDSLGPFMAQIISRIREPETKTYTQDGVCLTESGLSHLQSLVEPLTSPRRYRRGKPKLKLRIINQNSVSVLQTAPELDTPTEQDHSRGELECEMKSDSSPERDHAHDDDVSKEQEVTDGNKKRKRKPYRPGIGGFMVRQRGGKSAPSRIKLCRQDPMDTLPGRDEGLLDADVSIETVAPGDQTTEKVKKRYRKKKTKLEEAFPSYLQEAFFGRDLLEQSRQLERRAGPEAPGSSQSRVASCGIKGSAPAPHVSSPYRLPIAAMATSANKKQGTLPMSEDALMDLSDVLNTDPHILATGPTGQFQVERSPSPFAGLDISSVADCASFTCDPAGGGGRVQEEPLDAILSPELDKMVSDGAILSKLYNIPELEGKDVEEVFTAVLSPNGSNQSEPSQHTHAAAGSKMHTHNTAAVFPRLPLLNGLVQPSSHFSSGPTTPGRIQGAFRTAPPPEGPGPAPRLSQANQTTGGEGELESLSTTQRGTLKWEKEESLGEQATVAPVLYCNTNFPQLRQQYPDWPTRLKQITKLWRKASAQDRAPFVQKARDNRAAQRINKVQMANEPLKRPLPPQAPLAPPALPALQPPQPPLQPLQLAPGTYDPVSMDAEMAFKDPLRPKESEQEQEWKFRQQMRQKSKALARMEASQKLEQVKSEQQQLQLQQRQQQLAGHLSPDAAAHSPIMPGGGDSSPLQPSREAPSRQQHLLPQGGSGHDVFLRPQAPPPSGFSSLPHSPHPSSPLHQIPSSPQVFSPPSSRPSSPWDPYSKAVGTPRPTSSQTGAPLGPQQQQRRNSFSTSSPAHDAMGSPAPSPDSKTAEVCRSLVSQPGLQQSRPGVMSPSSGVRSSESFQRGGVRGIPGPDSYTWAGDVIQGAVFKAPMPPQHQPQQEVFGSPGGGRRDQSRPVDPGFSLLPSQDSSFPSSPLSGLSSPHRSPYHQTPGTPRPDYSQQVLDPLPSRPSTDPYASPQAPGTPRPLSDPAYLSTAASLRLDQYNQQPANRRPSPSHPALDPYGSAPGTPCPSTSERFPRSPGSQRCGEPYAQQPSTPRPHKVHDSFSGTPTDGLPPQPAGPSSSPLAPGLTESHQQSPGRPPLDAFPRAPGGHTPKHPGTSDEGFSSLACRTPGHDPFDPGHMTPGPSKTDKNITNDMCAAGMASLDGPMSMLPQLGDSEEKLRQRQRLRQLILRQQQQKSALRQEKGLQDQGPGPAPGSAAPLHSWSQDESSSAPPANLFGRPPPPYPGTVCPAGAPLRFPGGFHPSEAPVFRENPPRDLGSGGPNQRFVIPPGAPAGLQDSFLRPPQRALPASMLGVVGDVPVHMRRPEEFTGIRTLSPHMMPGVSQPFLPRALPLQPHSIMGQPYIELRHRGPEHRLRLPVPPPAAQDPVNPPAQLLVVRPGPGTPLMGQRVAMAGGVEPLSQQDQQHLSHPTGLGQTREAGLPGSEGIEEHLEGEDSAVKDLEDVEVKDLVDLNLNLDPEDGKEDLDLGPNDLHLDDFLLSGKFDLIAYADPELNLEDKKDMFNEELDLGEDKEEAGPGGPLKPDPHVFSTGPLKQEVKDCLKMEAVSRPPGPAAPLTKEGQDSTGSSSGSGPALQDQAQSLCVAARAPPPPAGGPHSFQQRPPGPSQTSSALLDTLPQGVLVPPHQLALQTPVLLNPQNQPPQQETSSQTQVQNQATGLQNQNKSRPLLLEEQPLLLQDLLDQERQEQQQHKHMQDLMRHKSTTPDPMFPSMDFDSISDPIMKAKMVALKGINKVMTQGNLSLNPIVINRFQQASGPAVAPGAPGPEGPPPPPQLLAQSQDGKLPAQLVRPNPPSFGPGFVNESQRRQYEEWLGETQQLLQMQQRLLEEQIAAHRKTKKALSAKQRTAKRAGRAFSQEDATQLQYISEQQGAVQKQLEQIRKQQKDHSQLIEDYRTKQQHRALQQPPAPPPVVQAPPPPQPLLSTPTTVPIQPPSVPPGWIPAGGAPGMMGQRMPPHLPSQTPPTLPTASQAPPHASKPPGIGPRLAPPTAGLAPGPRGPVVGPNGATGDAASVTPQVKFDDNNPFSEGFQERERRERLREQQERQRVQLMQEVDRHRALQQRLELEQQGLLGVSLAPGPGAPSPAGAVPGSRVGPAPAPGPGAPAGSVPVPLSDGLTQMPFFSSELPQDFLQSPPASRPPPQHQSAPPFPLQSALHQALHPGPRLAPELVQGAGGGPMGTPPTGFFVPSPQGQVRPAGIGPGGLTPSHPGAHRIGQDSSSSSPSTPVPASLIQLYSDIIPDDKPKKKRSRRKDGEDAVGGGGARTPLSSHSDDITAPPTPAVSDTSCSTPTRSSMDLSDASFPHSSALFALAPSSELERQLSVSAVAQQRGSILGMEGQRAPLGTTRLEVKKELVEGGACGGGQVKMEEGGGEVFSSSPLHGGDGGKELLRHLLRDKMSPSTAPSPTRQAPPSSCRQHSTDSVRSEEEEGAGFHVSQGVADRLGPGVLESCDRTKQQCKRAARPDRERAPPKNKRRRREEEDKTLHASSSTSSDPLVTHLRQLSVLPLMEPVLRVDLSLFPPYGSSSLGTESRLSGTFGSASLDGVTDYYSQLIYKQNNLSNPPTPPASLPPTPPPGARQKLVNGFATTEELSEQDIKGVSALKQKREELVTLSHTSKPVDVPASLPTPPHNNQEELRVQDATGRHSPDGFVPSSSPESVADAEISRYPDLSFIKLEPPSPCPSPTFPMVPCAWGKGSAVKQEVKVEPHYQAPPSCSNTDLVTIAITLNPVASQNVPGVMAAIAELLRVPVPLDYQLSRPGGAQRSSLALLAGVRVPLTQSPTSYRLQRPPPAAGGTGVRMNYIQHGGSAPAAVRTQCCSNCKVLLGNRVRIIKELKQEGPCRPGSSLVFCSLDCSALYTSDPQRSAGNKCAVPVMSSGSERPPPIGVQHQYTNNMSSITVHSLPHAPFSPPTSSCSSPPVSFPPASAVTMETRPRVDSLKVKVKLKPRLCTVPGGDDLLSPRFIKRVKSTRWRRWSISITLSRGPCIPNETVAMPTEEEVDLLLKKLGACLRPDPLPKDQRRCCFCHQQGDGQTDGPARLLNLDLDLWVHLNCALWSSEVYETQAGALINVELALRRGLALRCAHCQQTGATSGCNRLRCTNTYHFTCALQASCTFFKDKTMLCHLHKPRMVALSGDRSCSGSPSSTPGLTPDPSMVSCDPYHSELRCFAVFRRVFVQRDEARQIAAVVQRGERQHTFRVGSLLFRAVGRLLPQQMSLFHNQTAIFPIGYHANRIYWSMRHINRRCKYMCYIEEQEGRLLFKVKVVERGHKDLVLTGDTPKAVWDQILDPVSHMRTSSGTLKLFPVYLKGEDLFGLTTSAVTRIIESLPGVEACEHYTFRFGRNPLMEWPLAFNPSGSARSEPKACQAKRPFLLSSVAPRCQGSVGAIVGLVPGVLSLSPGESVAAAHQGRHSKSSQYRRMKAEWKTNVYLARSRIQGLGLYAARDIEKCTMVIEYIGTIIRSEVANRKERLYEAQNRGVYMFRIDNDYVIDATITGGPARYINHSCAPNCITEVVTVEKENKIIISSCRRIQRGEELSYDYKFDLEDDQHKIPCHCGAVNCRKWMN